MAACVWTGFLGSRRCLRRSQCRRIPLVRLYGSGRYVDERNITALCYRSAPGHVVTSVTRPDRYRPETTGVGSSSNRPGKRTLRRRTRPECLTLGQVPQQARAPQTGPAFAPLATTTLRGGQSPTTDNAANSFEVCVTISLLAAGTDRRPTGNPGIAVACREGPCWSRRGTGP